jgi:hypothetical protein
VAGGGGLVIDDPMSTVFVDDPVQGGSHVGAWARAIRDTPTMKVSEYEPARGGVTPSPAARADGAGRLAPRVPVPSERIA